MKRAIVLLIVVSTVAGAARAQKTLPFYLCASGHSLCASPETGSSYFVQWSSGAQSWSLADAVAVDLIGTSYTVHLYGATSGSSTDVTVEILIDDTVVATTGVTFTSAYPTFGVVETVVTGSDPAIAGPVSLELRLTHAGGATGAVVWGDLANGDDSYLVLPGDTAFTDLGLALPTAYGGEVAWGDYDGDGDLDFVLVGRRDSRIFRNDGGGTFTDLGLPLRPFHEAAAAWGDYDADGDLDLVLSGIDDSDCCNHTTLLRNDGSDTFTEVAAGFAGAGFGALAWGDADNDGDLDLLVAGSDDSGATTRLYRNDGADLFTPLDPGFVQIADGAMAAWADYDGDGDLDLALGGRDATFTPRTSIYRNEGGGVFTDVAAPLPQLGGGIVGEVAWGDYDNDGDPDLAFCGRDAADTLATYLFRNDGSDVFTQVAVALPEVDACTVAWGDHDGDGDLDLFVAGREAGSTSVSRLFRNDGGGSFTDLGELFAEAQIADAAWGDSDGDGDLDLLFTGLESGTRLYRNDSGHPDAPPAAPTGLAAAPMGGDVLFSWTAATDTETPEAALSYNLRVGSTPGGVDAAPPMADPATGRLRLPAAGNAQQRLTARLHLPAGAYYWSVQAIDGGFVGSPFATEGSFLTEVCTGNDATGDADADGLCADVDCDDTDPDALCPVFGDGFESGDTSAWSRVVP